MAKHHRISHRKLDHKNVEHRSSDNPVYFWIVGESSETGRRLIYGYKTSMEEAEKAKAKIHNATVTIYPLRTTDEDEVTRMMRAGVLEDTGDVDESYKRFRHTERV